MTLPIFANVEWPSAAVAIAITLALGGVIAIALARFTMDEVLKLWTAAGPVVGVIAGIFVGTFGTYFFTREATQAKIQAAQAESETQLHFAQAELNAYRTASDAVKTKLSPEDAKWFDEMIYVPTANKKPTTPPPKDTQWYQIYRSPKSPTPTP
jgi:hypothetical protein